MKINGRNRIDNSYDDIIDLIKDLLKGVVFDEEWYLARYSDVADAVNAGGFRSGRHHFIEVGYFEGRHPRYFEVDESWYVDNYPDVEQGIRNGEMKSARQHFNDYGYDEGRMPARG